MSIIPLYGLGQLHFTNSGHLKKIKNASVVLGGGCSWFWVGGWVDVCGGNKVVSIVLSILRTKNVWLMDTSLLRIWRER